MSPDVTRSVIPSPLKSAGHVSPQAGVEERHGRQHGLLGGGAQHDRTRA
jgi:hypothetical protein